MRWHGGILILFGHLTCHSEWRLIMRNWILCEKHRSLDIIISFFWHGDMMEFWIVRRGRNCAFYTKGFESISSCGIDLNFLFSTKLQIIFSLRVYGGILDSSSREKLCVLHKILKHSFSCRKSKRYVIF